MPTPSALASDGLVKKTLAEKLLTKIMNGSLSPGERIIEGRWAQHFCVAQGTIREAINLLERDGFVTKEGGRSARVTNLTEKDVVQLYQMRGAPSKAWRRTLLRKHNQIFQICNRSWKACAGQRRPQAPPICSIGI